MHAPAKFPTFDSSQKENRKQEHIRESKWVNCGVFTGNFSVRHFNEQFADKVSAHERFIKASLKS